MLIDATSLSRTVDALNAAQFDDRALSPAERREAAAWIAARQGLEGAYGGTFAGFPAERTKGMALFTGERIGSASARHILGEEARRRSGSWASAMPPSPARSRPRTTG